MKYQKSDSKIMNQNPTILLAEKLFVPF